MSKFLVFVFFFSLIVVPSGQSEASELSVQDLLESCKGGRGEFAEGFCLGTMNGAMHLLLLNRWVGASPFRICPAEGISTGQARQIFVNWAEKNPKEWQKEASVAVFASLALAYPCPPANTDERKGR